jgi:hypothetical protein
MILATALTAKTAKTAAVIAAYVWIVRRLSILMIIVLLAIDAKAAVIASHAKVVIRATEATIGTFARIVTVWRIAAVNASTVRAVMPVCPPNITAVMDAAMIAAIAAEVTEIFTHIALKGRSISQSITAVSYNSRTMPVNA